MKPFISNFSPSSFLLPRVEDLPKFSYKPSPPAGPPENSSKSTTFQRRERSVRHSTKPPTFAVLLKSSPTPLNALRHGFREHLSPSKHKRKQLSESYYNAPTYKNSRAHITAKFSKIAEEAVGKGSYANILSGFSDSKTDMAARISFKYGCSRGVMGTPFFFVNGIPLPDYGSALDYSKWKSIIDPLFAEKK
ncbi:hypothetical protein KSP39_PZI000921 [Platanthera zijinensis]|uniref:Thioredoxin-like fold domain-containing protein n=1 Tax=Platanthera zijinensis TaxID=2320716 RepID=A0AAP0GGM0_9ASPA